MSEAERLSYDRGWNDALDKAELMLRRHFEKLWPHDQNCAAVLDEIRVEPLDAAPAKEEKRRLPIICTNCGEEWSDGHADTCEPTLAAPAEDGGRVTIADRDVAKADRERGMAAPEDEG